MRKRLHIATLGLFRNMLVEHVIAKLGADKIVIIYTDENEEDLERIARENEAKEIPVISRRVDPWNYREVLSRILEVVSEHEDYELEYNISCGTRVMTAAAHRAALFTDSPVFFVTQPSANHIGPVVKVEPLSDAMLTEPKRNILKRLQDLGGSADSQRELGSREDLGASSISRHVNSLEKSGYIRKRQEGRRTRIELTDLGSVILNLKRHRKSAIWGS
jgi:CRISPR locus-related DNA-binding protein